MIDVKSLTKHLLTFHRQGPGKNVFIFSTARNGTTWLAEIIATQGRFKIVNEPFDLRWPVKRGTLRLNDWEELLYPENRPAIKSYFELYLLDPDQMRQNRMQLVDRWKAKVTSEREVRAFDTLGDFDIDYHEYGNLLPKGKYILKRNGKSMPAD